MRRFGRDFQAISKVLAVLLIAAVAIAGALVVVYVWTWGEIAPSFEGIGEIAILSIANDATDTDLLVYVQNVREDVVQLDEDECLYVDDVLVQCTISGVTVSDDLATLDKGETAMLRYSGGAVLPGVKVKVKVVTVLGTYAEKSAYPAESADNSTVDHFVFETIDSPQTSGVLFSVTITAVDQYSDQIFGYSGVNTLSFAGGEIMPTTTGTFSGGVWTGEVKLIGSVAEAAITTVAQSNSSWTGASNTFALDAPPAMWNQTYGEEWDDWAYALVATSDGGYALAGSTYSFGAVGNDFLVVKTDSCGNVEWSRTYGGTEFLDIDIAYSVVETSDGGYAIAGETRSFGAGMEDFWLIKTDSYGYIEWNQTYGGSGIDIAHSVVETSDGGYAIAGYTSSFGFERNVWLVKTDVSGNVEWSQRYGGSDGEDAYSLVATSDGGYAIAGYAISFADEGTGRDFLLIKTDAYGNIEWNRTYGGRLSEWAYSVVETSDEGYAIAGYTTSSGAGQNDFWLVKTDALGNEEWNQTYGSPYIEEAYAVVETSDGGYAMVGNINSAAANYYDLWLVKTDASGTMEWNQTYKGGYSDYASSLIETSDGGYAIAGYTDSFGAGNLDVWLIKTN